MKMRNDARKVISQHIINAVNELGGKAHSDDVKAWILATETWNELREHKDDGSVSTC